MLDSVTKTAGSPDEALHRIPRDEEGYLLDAGDWSPELAEALAAESGLAMTDEHRAVVAFVRGYFDENGKVPEARTMLKHMGALWGADRASRRSLYLLFPRGYGQQACKIAGMTKPRKLMLDV
jgi:tRNA 2-thiouridine synthesizing protein E